MLSSREKINKESNIFAIFIFFSMLLILLDSFGLLSSLRGLSDIILNPIKGKVYSVAANGDQVLDLIVHFKEEREKQKQIAKLEKDLLAARADIRRLAAENENLRKQLEASLPSYWKFQPAAVLGISRYMHIWAGSLDGVKEGMSVASGKIYVGKIISVFPHTSSVLLPTDPDAKIPAISSRGARGRVAGSFGEKLFFDKVLQKDALFIDDQIETTGEEGYAPGLLIGKVGKVESRDIEVYKKGELKPGVAYNKETTVFVVKED